jgi:hypothetical protein
VRIIDEATHRHAGLVRHGGDGRSCACRDGPVDGVVWVEFFTRPNNCAGVLGLAKGSTQPTERLALPAVTRQVEAARERHARVVEAEIIGAASGF